jgi:DNA-binding CsgD family transcriptional regulator
MVARLALTRQYQGRWTEATELAASILRVPAAAVPDPDEPNSWEAAACTFGVPLYIRAVALLALGQVRARRGDPGVWEALDEALVLATPGGTFLRLGPIYAARAEAAWLEGNREQARHEAHAGLECTVGHRGGLIGDEFAFWLWQAGESVALPDEPESPFALQVSGDWAGAAEAWQALGCPYEAARALADSKDEAPLRSALTTFEQLGARQASFTIKRQLQDIGARVIPRGPRPATRSHLANLTPREAEVLELVAAGNTNTEIASRLFVSPKTVEHHVSAIFSKLGTRTRSGAIQRAQELGALSPK